MVGRRVALQVQRLAVGLAELRVEDELRRPTRVADALRLVERHVIAHAVLRLAGGEGLQEGGATILERIEDRPEELGRVGNRDLRDKRRTVPGEKSLGDGLLLDDLSLAGGTERIHVAPTEHRRGI